MRIACTFAPEQCVLKIGGKRMRRSHVEGRARRYAARQYVSDTHSHKPDAKRPKPIVKDESEEEETAADS